MTARSLVVKCTTDDSEPAAQAFNVAGIAAASGVSVSVWLTGDAVHFATPGRAEREHLPHAAPLAELRDMILASGSLTVCAQCALRRSLTESDFLPGVRIAGAAAFVAEVLVEQAQALVY